MVPAHNVSRRGVHPTTVNKHWVWRLLVGISCFSKQNTSPWCLRRWSVLVFYRCDIIRRFLWDFSECTESHQNQVQTRSAPERPQSHNPTAWHFTVPAMKRRLKNASVLSAHFTSFPRPFGAKMTAVWVIIHKCTFSFRRWRLHSVSERDWWGNETWLDTIFQRFSCLTVCKKIISLHWWWQCHLKIWLNNIL